MANGTCQIEVHDEAPQLGETSIKASHKTVDKVRFEAGLIPVVVLALDGVLPAVQSLETAAAFPRATALHRLLTKIIRCLLLKFWRTAVAGLVDVEQLWMTL